MRNFIDEISLMLTCCDSAKAWHAKNLNFSCFSICLNAKNVKMYI